MFEFLDHTADAAVRLTASDVPGLLQSGVEALLSLYLGEENRAEFQADSEPGSSTELRVTLQAEDADALLIDFLNELIFLFDTRRFLCMRIEVDDFWPEGPSRVMGKLVGKTYTAERYRVKTEVKAATFHDVEIVRQGDQLTVDVVFDL